MARRARASRREIAPDPLFNSELAGRLINKVMMNGKKTVAQGIVYRAMTMAGERLNREPVEVLEAAVRNAMPILEVRPRRVGGATYQVPVEVRPERRLSIALRWLVASSRNRSERTMAERLAAELMDAANNTGATVRKREETHRMAEANRAFAHYRW